MNIINRSPEFNRYIPKDPHYTTISLDKKAAMLKAIRRNKAEWLNKEIARANWRDCVNNIVKEIINDYSPLLSAVHFPELLTIDCEWNKEALYLLLHDSLTHHDLKQNLLKQLDKNKNDFDNYLLDNGLKLEDKTNIEWLNFLNIKI